MAIEQPRDYTVVQPVQDANGQTSYQRVEVERPEPVTWGTRGADELRFGNTGPAPATLQRNAKDPSPFDFFASAEMTTVYLDADHGLWIRLRKELDYGQQSEIDGASLRGVTVQDARQATQQQQMMVFDVGHQRLLKISMYIDDWSLPQKWPERLDARYQLVKRLKPKWATMILTEIERLEAAANPDADALPNADAAASPEGTTATA